MSTQTMNAPTLRLAPTMSKLAVVGLVLSAIGLPQIGFALSWGGLVDTRHGKRGRGLAIAGLIVGAVMLAILGILVATSLPALVAEFQAEVQRSASNA